MPCFFCYNNHNISWHIRISPAKNIRYKTKKVEITLRVEIMTDKLTSPRNESHLVGHWPTTDSSSKVPIYHVDTIHEFNRLIGYAKFKNGSHGTVLYRGQNKDYGALVPSGARPGKGSLDKSIVKAICNDELLLKFIQLNDADIAGWNEYQQVIVESIIQHYGGNTLCMDFVDNHWSALWFGVYKFEENKYHIRTDSNGNLYVYLYLADTNGATIRGMSIGEDTYTVDLRKALPSIFQRPASQHGWIVREKKAKAAGCNYNNRVIGVIEVSVSDAIEWIGNGTLMSQENFFPSFEIDQGYSVLLQRQYRSGLISTYRKVLPSGTICNYNLRDTFFCSDSKPILTKKRLVIDHKAVNTLESLYDALLKNGWQQNTCEKSDVWKEDNPCEYQSGPTALLVQLFFGGDIGLKTYRGFAHYYNIIDGTIVDLASQSLLHLDADFYSNGKNIGRRPNSTWERYKGYLKILIDNCKIDDTVIYPPIIRKRSSSKKPYGRKVKSS